MGSVSESSKRVSSDFRRVVEGFLLRPGLPFAGGGSKGVRSEWHCRRPRAMVRSLRNVVPVVMSNFLPCGFGRCKVEVSERPGWGESLARGQADDQVADPGKQ